MRFFLFLSACIIATAAIFTYVSGGFPILFMDTEDPLIVVVLIAGCFTFVCFTAGAFTDDYSWVDRLWSMLPAVYSWIYAWRGWPDPRLILVSVLVTLWAARLTFNFARKGGYGRMEDYRWAEVRKSLSNKFVWQAFNLVFISFYQNLLFILFTLPVYAAYLHRGIRLGPLDAAAAVLFLGFLFGETLADQQQWNFQKAKRAPAGADGRFDRDIARGFLTTGLFRFSRHPNFFCEQSVWWVVYFFGFLTTGQPLHWSGIGAVLLTLLFQGSTALTEKISGRKYPEYARYKKNVSRIIPWFPGRME